LGDVIYVRYSSLRKIGLLSAIMSKGQDEYGRFTPGNKLSPGRPRGSRNKQIEPMGFRYFKGAVRTSEAGRFYTILASFVSDLGGRSELSAAELQLARRCAQISVACEIMEHKAAKGEDYDLGTYGMLTGHLTRALKTIGLKRQPRDVTPSLQDYLDARASTLNDDTDDVVMQPPEPPQPPESD
jgi:hypothetical protein